MSFPLSGVYLLKWITGYALPASEAVGEFQNVYNNLMPGNIDDYSNTQAQMDTTADPYPGGAPSLATNLQEELTRIRYQIKQLSGQAQWYNVPPGRGLRSVQVFTASGTWTKPAGTRYIRARIVGGGGGGGAGNSAVNGAQGGGGGAGAYCENWVDVSAVVSYGVTIGAGGAGGATTSAAGNAGGASGLGTIGTANGGAGGNGGTGVGGIGGTSSGGLLNCTGGAGQTTPAVANGAGANGGSSMLGGGGLGINGAGGNGGVYGSGGAGGGGGSVYGGGGTGAAGIVIVEEFA